VQEFAVRENLSLFQALLRIGDVPMLQARMVKSVNDFVGIVTRYQDMMQELSPASLAQAYIDATGLPQMYRLQQTDDAQDRWNNIERILDHIAEQQELNEEMTLVSYLEQISLLSDADDPQTGNDRIAMMTMHAAKGLEFPLVVIAGLEQGLFPLAKAEQDPAEQEEERRLLYVGITRAREQLILSYAERRYRFGELVFSRPSMFLSEIDTECLAPSSRSMAQHGASIKQPAQPAQPARPQPRGSAYSQVPERGSSYSQLPMPKRYTSVSQPKARNAQEQSAGSPTLRTGQRVKHPMFGNGTVSSVSGTGQSEKATVLFDNGQRKQLMVAFARLEVIA
jgi:DNA helicase-2/ATP-dependent DNA helicase PcrA